jgi:hypothetical protein
MTNEISVGIAIGLVSPVILSLIVCMFLPKEEQWGIKTYLLVCLVLLCSTMIFANVFVPIFSDTILGMIFLVIGSFLVSLLQAQLVYGARWTETEDVSWSELDQTS